jgi:hypothetical protein
MEGIEALLSWALWAILTAMAVWAAAYVMGYE